MSETVEFLGTKYPVIKRLDEKWCLIAHPNGPAITNGEWICTIDRHGDNDFFPEMKQRGAIAWREFSWPLLKEKFYP